ncbi:MAG: DNA-3-methyladenine glycosylase [Chloroflexi bacterium]|jgi:DNA-3-methyladenine glycosylase|nr:DNA-3-methyladenine glycosylase [Anaerolineaceae bacterium]NLI44292.1 DNA-3-methyladenine glycosylase [Chloroflexota bacterium]HOE34712.1 DNA-3-methyladenine glycosylase [Anaerolineaceae bacterium]HOT25739.1 DNA-3-methyladenine glycosylase [Anaerolineaceae bacterium]HQH57986.1 DNA-3-methyladenine glycosylase [Anaerolineaceae bacterium]
MILSRAFYSGSAIDTAPRLIGCRLVRILDGRRLSGIITETEAYQGEEDQACHARVGKTPRTETMYEEAGHAYIYFTYGMHWLLNAVTDAPGIPAAVLIRAIFPLEGADLMAALRPMLAYQPGWLNGPAKLAQALNIDGRLNRADLCSAESALFIEEGISVPPETLRTAARVGINSVPEPWRSVPWRWQADPEFIRRMCT